MTFIIQVYAAEIAAITEWLANCGLSKAKASQYAGPLVVREDIGSIKKAELFYAKGKLVASLAAVGMDDDNIDLVITALAAAAAAPVASKSPGFFSRLFGGKKN